MGAKPKADTKTDQPGKARDAADYLADILPQLADIARKGRMDDLASQIDSAAGVARQQLRR